MWGCIDLVSASTGEMKKRYGFIYVDKDNGRQRHARPRSRKDSFFWCKEGHQVNGADLASQVSTSVNIATTTKGSGTFVVVFLW